MVLEMVRTKKLDPTLLLSVFKAGEEWRPELGTSPVKIPEVIVGEKELDVLLATCEQFSSAPDRDRNDRWGRCLDFLNDVMTRNAPRLTDKMTVLMSDPDTTLRIAAARGLLHTTEGARPALSYLSALIGDTSLHPAYRLRAIAAVMAAGETASAALPVLIAVLPEEAMRSQASLAISLMGPSLKPFLPDLIAALDINRADQSKALYRAIDATGTEGRDAAIAALDSPDPEHRAGVENYLGQVGDTIVPALVGAYEGLGPDGRLDVMELFRYYGPGAAPALPLIRKVIAKEKDERLLSEARFALERIEEKP